MPWDIDSITKHPCPCGKGEWEFRELSDDRGNPSADQIMNCPDCRGKYTYVGKPKEWVLTSVLEQEKKYVQDVGAKAKELYQSRLVSRLLMANDRKELWAMVTNKGIQGYSLNTYYTHNKGISLADLKKSAVNHFNFYYDLKRILELCVVVNPDWDALGVNEEDKKRFKPDLGILGKILA